MYIQSRFLTQNPTFLPLCSVSSKLCRSLPFSKNLSNFALVSRRNRFSTEMSLNSKLLSQVENVPSWFKEEDMDRFVEVGNKVADAAGEVIRRYFRNSFEVLDREDLSML
uniref:Uncharacterized protein n=1 Tax=Nelumbo nucifera TaxID=4432 RepID=A0A822Z5T6_NELNU|nr:TPA_asm: hypothetical protein HUJ06_014530 [Nelumbo nucifera]